MKRAAVVAALAGGLAGGCGAPTAPRLGAAGGRNDDATGQLAAASVRLRYDGSGDAPTGAADDRFERRHVDVYGFGGYGGFGYGGFGYGGIGYGGIGYGAWGGIGYGPPPPQPPPYNATVVVDGGAIEGSVRWKAGGGVPWPAGCDAARVARAGAPVGGAVVYLDGLRAGRTVPYAMALIRTGSVAEVTACAIVPTVQLASPLPVQLLVENGDRATVRLEHARPGGVTTVELEAGGRAQLALERAGESQLRDGVRAPAWVMAQAHPYYVLTTEDGRFALDEVPAGTWDLVVWTPPLVTAVGAGGPTWSPATIERRRVTVGKRTLTTVDVALTPAR